jgi:hypothetical protein
VPATRARQAGLVVLVENPEAAFELVPLKELTSLPVVEVIQELEPLELLR